VKRITLVPLGLVDHELIVDLRKPLEEAFRTPVVISTARPEIGVAYDATRMQHNSTALLRLLASVNEDGDRCLAICAQDLFIPIMTFVFGEAELHGRHAVMSYYRLRNELFGLAPDPAVLYQRSLKEAKHELGHTYGLLHCSSLQCVMHASTDAVDVDAKGSDFCRECLDVIRSDEKA
jgi:archaemetzincin